MFPKVAPGFFKKRGEGPVVFKPEPEAPQSAAPAAPAPGAAARYSVNVNGANYDVVVAPAGMVAVTPAPGAAAPAAPAAPVVSGGTTIAAPVAGTIIRYVAAEGAQVKSGDTILIIESMKMELEIKSTASGPVHFLAPAGTQVAAQQPVASIGGTVSAAPAPAPAPAPAAPAAPVSSGGTAINAPVAGTVIRYVVNEGAAVNSGDTIIIIESMKMELEIKATAAGKVHFLAPAGAQVAAQQPIAEIQ
jgi:oxaloacetate decarboxylase alpha subunit